MNKKLSVLLALALTVTALSACSMSSGKDRSDDLRVDREGGDYKHEYGDETETDPVIITETTEEPTTTTTEEPTTTTTSATYASQGVLHSLQDAADVISRAMGQDYNSSVSILENAFGTKFSTITYDVHGPDIDDYPETLIEYDFNCDVVIYGFGFDELSIWCDEDNRVIEISFCYHSSDKNQLWNYYDYFRADLPGIYGSPIEESNDDENVNYTTYGPLNGITCTASCMYWGEGQKYNMAILGFNLEE
ncbi:MAG: hypothetical protein IKS75_03120 [Clostridiales bacterium]|nr:hypothetical protein [Clostridiales bacterium]